MFLSVLLFAFSWYSLVNGECSLEENINDDDVSYMYSCDELTITFSYINGTGMGQLTFSPANYDECVVIAVDKLPKLDSKEILPLESLELSISNTELDKSQSYSEIVSKLGFNSNIVATVSVLGCPNLTLTQLKGFDMMWSLDISSSLSSDTANKDINFGQLFPKLRTLRLDANQLKISPSFSGMKMLEEAFFSFNGFEELPENLFKDNPMLTNIDISESDLKKFPSNICKGHQNLEHLNLYIGLAPFPVLKDCFEVRQLYVQRSDEVNREVNNINDIPLFPDMTKLSSLILSTIGLDKITRETFEKNIYLNSLTLSFNGIEEIDDDAFKSLTKLTDIDLSYNNITKLSDRILPLNIERFSASGSLIKQFQITTSLPKLGYLDLSRSELSGTFEFKNVPKIYPSLQYLSLPGNNLSNFIISGSIDFSHDKDVEIDLSDNKIKTVTISDLTDSNDGLTRIILDLSRNPLVCDCALKPFLKALQDKDGKIKVSKNVYCDSPKGESIKTMDLSKLNC